MTRFLETTLSLSFPIDEQGEAINTVLATDGHKLHLLLNWLKPLLRPAPEAHGSLSPVRA